MLGVWAIRRDPPRRAATERMSSVRAKPLPALMLALFIALAASLAAGLVRITSSYEIARERAFDMTLAGGTARPAAGRTTVRLIPSIATDPLSIR